MFPTLANVAPGPVDWLPATFKPFTHLHVFSVAVCLVLMICVAVLGRLWRGSAREVRLCRGLAIAGLFYWVGSNAWWCWPGNFQGDRSLPLHICDLAGLIGPLALLTGRRRLRTTLYFWGFALSTQAFFTPVITEGPTRPEFWFFWANHTFIVGTALYDVVARGYRPAFEDVLVALGISLLYAALILPFDLATGWNYGYVGNVVPENPTLIDKLGPWPLRLIPLTGIVIAAYLLVWLPWPVARSLSRGKASPP